MRKVLLDLVIIVAVVLAYVIMASTQGMTNDIISTVNASANWTGAELGQNAMSSYPLYQWFIPGLVGIIALVVNHKT